LLAQRGSYKFLILDNKRKFLVDILFSTVFEIKDINDVLKFGYWEKVSANRIATEKIIKGLLKGAK